MVFHNMIYHNEACIVINKLPGESSENFRSENIQLEKNEGDKFPAPVHRLDVPVSGCLLLAKTPEAAAFLGSAFASRDNRVEKHYWAIAEKFSAEKFSVKKFSVESFSAQKPPMGKIENALPEEGELVHWLGVNSKTNKAFALPLDTAEKHNAHKKAILRYKIAGQGDHYLFLSIDLVTGRHHQIRAQLAALGLHIKGDLKYGARRSEKSGGIRLHAYSLAFPNPLKPDEVVRVKALPPVMDPLWTAFQEAVKHQA